MIRMDRCFGVNHLHFVGKKRCETFPSLDPSKEGTPKAPEKRPAVPRFRHPTHGETEEVTEVKAGGFKGRWGEP